MYIETRFAAGRRRPTGDIIIGASTEEVGLRHQPSESRSHSNKGHFHSENELKKNKASFACMVYMHKQKHEREGEKIEMKSRPRYQSTRSDCKFFPRNSNVLVFSSICTMRVAYRVNKIFCTQCMLYAHFCSSYVMFGTKNYKEVRLLLLSVDSHHQNKHTTLFLWLTLRNKQAALVWRLAPSHHLTCFRFFFPF